MPGVFRPYSLADVLGTMNQEAQQQTGDTVSGLSDFAESDESSTVSEAFATSVVLPPAWDAGTWGTAVWS